MPIRQRWTVIGIFEEQDQAKQTMNDLLQDGFSDGQMGFVFREGVPMVSKADVGEGETTSAFTGGIVGGVLGAASALLTPVLGPSVATTIPTATMPVAEEIIDRFQNGGTDEKRDAVAPASEPVASEHTQDEMTTPSVKAPTAEHHTAPEEQTVGSEKDAGKIPTEEQVIAPDEKRMREDEATGAVAGGIVGGVLGAAVALLIPVLGPAFAGGILVAVFSAALGAVTGSFLGAFVSLGVPEEQARHYEHEFKAGRTILTVKTDDRQQKVLDSMHRHHARYANAHENTQAIKR